jgi:hypothetical protein
MNCSQRAVGIGRHEPPRCEVKCVGTDLALEPASIQRAGAHPPQQGNAGKDRVARHVIDKPFESSCSELTGTL